MRAVLVVGCERSGTTMLGSMLGTAEGCLVSPEAQWVFELLALERTRPTTHADILRLVKPRMPPLWGEASLAYLHTDPGGIGALDWFRGLLETYAEDRGQPEPTTWISHAPLAMRYLMTAASAFDELAIVHIVRDGRAVYASLREMRPLAVSTPRQAALLWRERLCFALAAEHCTALPGVLTVRYEDLVAHPAPTLARIGRETGLDIPSSAVSKGAFSVPNVGHRLVGQAPDPTRIDAWKSRLAPREVELFEHYSEELLQYFAYEPLYGSTARGPSTREWIAMNLREVARASFHAAERRARLARRPRR